MNFRSPAEPSCSRIFKWNLLKTSDQDVVKARVLEKIEERIKEADFDLVFWNRNEHM